MSLAKLQSFSCDASKKSSEENDECKSQRKPAREVENDDCGSRSRKVAKNRCRDENEKKCGKTQQKDGCGRNSRVSSRKSTTCEKEQEKESCKHNTCPELLIRQCNWERELDETGQKRDAKERATQSKDPNCSQKKDIDTRCCQSKAEQRIITFLYCYSIVVALISKLNLYAMHRAHAEYFKLISQIPTE